MFADKKARKMTKEDVICKKFLIFSGELRPGFQIFHKKLDKIAVLRYDRQSDGRLR